MSKAGQRKLDNIAATAIVVRRMYPRSSDVVALMAEVLRAATYDSDIRAGISDPTPHAAMQIGPWLYWQREVEDTIVVVDNGLRRLEQLMHRAPSDIDTKAIVRQHQCQGGRLSAVDPDAPDEAWRKAGLCEALYDRPESKLCEACYKRWRRSLDRVA